MLTLCFSLLRDSASYPKASDTGDMGDRGKQISEFKGGIEKDIKPNQNRTEPFRVSLEDKIKFLFEG